MEQQEPQQSPREESIFSEADFSMQDYNKHIKNARTMLFVIAGIQLIPIFMLGPLEENVKLIAIGIYLFISAVFVGLAFWTRKSPYPALITATIFFVSLHVLFAILDPATIIQGLILKVVAIVLLVLGIRNAKEAKDLKEAFGK